MRSISHSDTVVLILFNLWGWTGAAARADVYELASGGRVEGQIVADAAADKAKYVIDLAGGGRLTIPRSDVTRIDATSEFETQYAELARKTPDTVEAHWKLSEWCREHKLRDRSQQHLARILELDPNHPEARNLLGFRKAGGQWMTRDQVMAARGMVKYEGRYVTRQHIELLELQKKVDGSQADWAKELERLQRRLTGRRADPAQARTEILAIRDPLAADALVALIRRENDPEFKRLWIDVVAQLDSQLAIETLIDLSLKDPDEELRNVCLEHVVRSGRPGIVTPYIRALKGRDNELINRAGAALGQIGDRDAIGPLIDALVSKHKIQITEGTSGDQHGYTFTEGGGGFAFGSKAPKFENRSVQNPRVLAALVALAGTSFDYDQPQWRTWLAAQAKLNAVDVRRDE